MVDSYRRVILLALLCLITLSCQQAPTHKDLVLREENISTDGFIVAKMYDAGFPQGDSNYKCLYKASDGKFYYAICCHRTDTHTQMYTFDPQTKTVKHLADVGEIVGEKGKRSIPQGKIHVNIFEHKGKLYTSTHIGYYKPASEIEEPGTSEGYLPYPGGHFISYDLKTGKFEDLAKAPIEEGIITMTMDKQRERLYGLTWPSGIFITYDIPTKKFSNYGPVFGKGERGSKAAGEWMFLCRSFGLDPRDGDIYWSNTKGEIWAYRYDTNKIEMVKGCNLNLDLFGKTDIWRSIVWYPKENVFYAVHISSSYLFRFDPIKETIEPLEQICPAVYKGKINTEHPTQMPGASLAYHLGPDGDTIYYFCFGPSLITKSGRKIRNTLHFVTYNIPTRTYCDHGIIRLGDGRYPFYAQAVEEHDGMIYTVPWIDVPNDGSKRFEEIATAHHRNIAIDPNAPVYEINLISFPDPYLKGKSLK